MRRAARIGIVALLAVPLVAVAAAATAAEAPLCSVQPAGVTQVGEELRITYRSPSVTLDLRRLPPSDAVPELVWREELSFPDASYIAPRFGHFDLPAGAFLVVRSPDGARSWEYRDFGKADLGMREGFWGIHIPGDRAVLELYSNRPLPAGAVEVESIAHGFPVTEPVEPELPESLCGADDSQWAKCYQTSEPSVYDHSRAVARLLINGTSACTGWLIGSAGHLITNEHCIGSSSAALNTDYELMAEGATCSTNCASWFACPGTVVATSATLVQLDAALDYSLVRLPSNPTGTYGYLQLRDDGASLGERIYIPQHAAAWGKRIGVASSHTQNPSGYCEVDGLAESPCSGGPGDVGYYCDTQGGSSGSPVLGYGDHLVVALHHCRGDVACTSSGGDANRGVPIEAIIADLGANLPPDAIGSAVPPGYYRCVVDVAAGTDTCDDGVVTVTASSGNQRVASIDLSAGYQRLDAIVDLCNPSGYSVHFADSPTCDGWGGDYGTTNHNAETHLSGTGYYFFGTDPLSDPATLETGVLPATGCYPVHWAIQEDRVRFDDDGNPADAARIDLTSFKSFERAPYNETDSEDPTGADANLWYAGLNRTVGSAYRSGSGVQRACFVLSQTTNPDPAIIADLCD
jgi:hypothetical protein